ncbi:hypothetical protein J2Z23_003068 [Lederbergia galactosidilyticus]|uniref:hypothetical protein n=1 Tax=Lederbergia galactosidilytica TaxID=217031 RepID=UPI001AE45C35|nr:hypothetical protein [Lederbergia galactosidilytica]MBP1916086.1 hypothetical protein [Lederbergia galactosidilytica]
MGVFLSKGDELEEFNYVKYIRFNGRDKRVLMVISGAIVFDNENQEQMHKSVMFIT